MTRPLAVAERERLAEALESYAAGVQENLADDASRDHELELDGEPNELGTFPVVEDYLADAERIRAGESPLHELTREVLADSTGPAALDDDAAGYLELVARLEP